MAKKTFTVRLDDDVLELMDFVIGLEHEEGKSTTRSDIMRAALPILADNLATQDPEFAASLRELAQRCLDRYLEALAEKLGQSAVVGLILPEHPAQ